MIEKLQTIESQQIREKYVEMLMNTASCRGLERIPNSISNAGIQVAKETHDFPKYEILIVRSQWTKCVGGWSIRVNNYYNTKRHFLQIPMDSLKDCRAIIKELKETGNVQFWTGHLINAVSAVTVSS
tara:strand:- start:68 stop:448 length:381 start_codon:yes stop_codon:yes gene_type:complete